MQGRDAQQLEELDALIEGRFHQASDGRVIPKPKPTAASDQDPGIRAVMQSFGLPQDGDTRRGPRKK